jgi:hypothetical protein
VARLQAEQARNRVLILGMCRRVFSPPKCPCSPWGPCSHQWVLGAGAGA